MYAEIYSPVLGGSMRANESAAFDEVAELYDAVRPSYPVALEQTILSVSAIKSPGTILEIGSGTGKATALFARHGYAIHCIEPGRNLGAIAVAKFQANKNVVIERTTFEDWLAPVQAFDLAISAQAFHRIPTGIGYRKVAQALKANGWFALFWNMAPDPSGDIMEALEEAYRCHAPMLWQKHREQSPYEVRIHERIQSVLQSRMFGNLRLDHFPWTERYTVQQYRKLLETYWDHHTLPLLTKQALYGRIGEILDSNGGEIVKPYEAVLYLAQKLS